MKREGVTSLICALINLSKQIRYGSSFEAVMFLKIALKTSENEDVQIMQCEQSKDCSLPSASRNCQFASECYQIVKQHRTRQGKYKPHKKIINQVKQRN